MGTIGWFAKNSVAANLLMVMIVVGGAIALFGVPLSKLNPGAPDVPPSIKQEVFPEFSIDIITVSVLYLGATPEEVEQAVCTRIEEAIQGLDGVKKLRSIANEGVGVVSIELRLGEDSSRVLDEVKARVDAIDTFPEETERPVIQEMTNRREVIDVAVYGAADEKTLRHLAEQVRDELTALPEITLAELANSRAYEVSVEVSENTLRRHGLSLGRVAQAIRRSSLDLPGGSVKTAGGEILLRTQGQAYDRHDFEQLVLIARPDGTHLRLGDVSTVIDGFADTDQYTRLNGEPAMLIKIFRVGDQDALSIGTAVHDYIASASERMPEGIRLTSLYDAAKLLRDRRDLLLRNGMGGIVLVFLTLGLFMRFRLAFWVVAGMIISFMGAIWLMPVLDVSVNMISLFAFILVLGIVVDDAIIAGENIHTHQHRSGDGLGGAIAGAREVSLPVVFAVLTTVAAFAPLMRVPGTMGKIMRVIPLIVIPCLAWSLVESLWILPGHLKHYRHEKKESRGARGAWHRFQDRFADGLQTLIQRGYRPFLERALRQRYLTAATGIAILLLTVGLVAGDRIKFVFFPDVEADYLSAALTMPPGTPAEVTAQAILQLEGAAATVQRELLDSEGVDYFTTVVTAIGEHPFNTAQKQNGGEMTPGAIASHLGEVTIELRPSEDRTVSGVEIADRWRELTGQIPDSIGLTYSASLFAPGDDVDVQLTGSNLDSLRAAAEELKQKLRSFTGVYEIGDSFRPGKEEIKLSIKPAAETLGLTLSDLALQVRQAFYGEEAQRIQRGRNDVRIMVRYPQEERRSLGDLENMRVRTPAGGEVPFSEVASVEMGRGFASITRVNRQRAINVTADVDAAQAAAGPIIRQLDETILPEIVGRYPGVNFSFEGQQAEQRDTIAGLIRGFMIALLAIFALLAIPLRSYAQPLVIMAAIPFGLIGAIWGHVIMGMELTILSMFGLVALTGVAVNDSLVMVDFINRHRATTEELQTAVRNAGMARFRAILLTSLTTFAGLFPLLMERSMQARFLIPMAVSLAFGVIFATVITLVLVPAGYLIMEDLRALPRRWRSRKTATVQDSTGKGGHALDSA